MKTKICTQCKIRKPVSDFFPEKRTKNGLQAECKKCHDYHRRLRRLHQEFGIDEYIYLEMFDKQKGRCAICGKHQSVLARKLDIDHNHATGQVRGLLCRHCNLGIGYFFENINIIQKSINYLRLKEGERGLLWRKQLGCIRLEDEEYVEWRKSL